MVAESRLLDIYMSIHPSILDDYYWDFIHVQASLMMITAILSMTEHPWLYRLGFYQGPSILDYVDWDSIKVQASLMMIIAIWSVSKHAWCWLLRFDLCPSILMMITVILSMLKHLDDDYSDFIHVKASWWWLLQFDPCLSILDYVDWDSIKSKHM